MPIEDFLFSAGGGFLLGAVAGYAIKKVVKFAAAVIGLFVAGLAYLSYRGCFYDIRATNSSCVWISTRTDDGIQEGLDVI